MLVSGDVALQVQGFALLLVVLHEFPPSPFFSSCQGPSRSEHDPGKYPPLHRFVSSADMLRVHCPVVQIINEVIKWD